MPIKFGSSDIAKVMSGTSAVSAIYAGAVKVWPSFSRQRMNKSGLHAATSGNTFYQVDGFVADGTYPGDVSGGNSMRVANSGVYVVTAHCVRAGTSGSVVFQLRRNGNASQSVTRIVSGTTSGDMTWTGTLADGDYLGLWQYRNGAAGPSSGCTDGTYVEIVPGG